MKIYFLSPLINATGNATTCLRIQSFLEDLGHTVYLRDTHSIKEERRENGQHPNVTCTIEKEKLFARDFDFAIGIHAYRSGKYLVQLDVSPFS
jgi:hypothetical protein